MGLFIPTSSISTAAPFSEDNLQKGILTNLDNNEFISFQFNPETFDYEQAFNWDEISWKGSQSPDLDFVSSGSREFDLTLVFVHEPSAPPMEIGLNNGYGKGETDFETIEFMLDQWCRIVPGKARPARINLSFGDARYFNVVITNKKIGIIEAFPDLSAKIAKLRLELKEWEPLQ